MNKEVLLKYFTRNRIILLLILVLAAILRFYNIDFQSPWLDEIHTINESNPEYSITELYGHIKKGEQLPPLYFYLIFFVFKIFGYTIMAARMFSAIVGVISVYALYLLVKELINKRVALIASLFMSINYFMIWYSQEARPYMLFVMFTILSFYWIVLFMKKQSIKNTIWFAVISCLMIHSHIVGFFTLFAQAVTLVLFLILEKDIDKKLFFKRGLLAATILIVLYIPAFDSLLSITEIKNFWIKPPDDNALTIIYNRFFGQSEIVSFFNLMFFIGFLYWLFKIKKDTQEKSILSQQWVALIIILWIAFAVLIPVIRTHISVPMIIDRYFIAIVPTIIIILAIGIGQIKNKAIYTSLIVFYVVFSLVHIFFIKDYYTKISKAQFRESTSFIMEYNSDGDHVVTSLSWYIPYFFNNENKDYEVMGASLDEFVLKMKNGQAPVESFWYFDGHNRTYNPSEETISFLNKNFISKNSFSGFQAWTKHYVVKNSTNTKISLSDEKYKALLASSSTIKRNIEKYSFDKKRLSIKGWAFLDNSNSKDTQIKVLLLKDKIGYFVELTRNNRSDVTSFFNLDYNADFSGFEIDTDISHIPNGNYKLALLLKNETKSIEGIFITNKEILIQ